MPPQPQDQDLETAENEKPEELDSLIPYSEDNVFVFIVDCSGSMSGSKMEMTKEALELFIKSLPAGAPFEIILFGSSYKLLSGNASGFKNNDETVNSVIQLIRKIGADMGGTNIFEPLKHSIDSLMEPVSGMAKLMGKAGAAIKGAL